MSRPDEVLRALAGYRLRRASGAQQPRVSAALAPFGLRRTTFSALAVIADRPGLTQARLGEALAVEGPNMTQIVGELQAAGLVTRARSEADGRAYALRATEAGRAVESRARRAVSRIDRALVRGLSEAEVAALARALDLIERNASEVEDDVEISRA